MSTNKQVNPFSSDITMIRTVQFSLDYFLFELGLTEDRKNEDKFELNGVSVKLCSMNPFVYDKNGEKFYYQRGYVWTLKDKQNLITSLCNGNSLGQVVCRKRDYDELEQLIKNGETDLAFRDIIDGKQRLTALAEFYNNEFPDEFGNYYRDFDMKAKRAFEGTQLLKFSETYKSVDDEFVLRQFLKANVAGVPQDASHLELIKSKL